MATIRAYSWRDMHGETEGILEYWNVKSEAPLVVVEKGTLGTDSWGDSYVANPYLELWDESRSTLLGTGLIQGVEIGDDWINGVIFAPEPGQEIPMLDPDVGVHVSVAITLFEYDDQLIIEDEAYQIGRATRAEFIDLPDISHPIYGGPLEEMFNPWDPPSNWHPARRRALQELFLHTAPVVEVRMQLAGLHIPSRGWWDDDFPGVGIHTKIKVDEEQLQGLCEEITWRFDAQGANTTIVMRDYKFKLAEIPI